MKRIKLLLSSLILTACLYTATSNAQSAINKAEMLDAEVIRSQLKVAESVASPEDENSQRLIQIYRQTLNLIDADQTNKALSQQYVFTRENGDKTIAALKAELKLSKSKLPVQGPIAESNSKASDIEPLLQKEKANRSSISSQYKKADQAITLEKTRPSQISQELIAANQRFQDASSQLQTDPDQDLPDELSNAIHWKLVAQSEAAKSEAQKLDQELLSQSIRVSILDLQKKITSAQLEYTNQTITLLESELKQRQDIETRELIDRLDTISLGNIDGEDIIRPYIDRNTELKATLRELTEKLDEVRQKNTLVASTIQTVNDNYEQAQRRLEIAGMTQALGRVMHQQRRDLPDLSRLRKEEKIRSQTLSDAGLRQIQLETLVAEYTKPDNIIAAQLKDTPELDTPELRRIFTDVLEQGKVLLESNLAANSDYLRYLSELDFNQTKLIQATETANEFLNERLLWVQNLKPIAFGALAIAAKEFDAIFFNKGNWRQVGNTLQERLRTSLLLPALLFISLILVAMRKKLHTVIRETGRYVQTPRDSIILTIKALFTALLIALPIPLMLYGFYEELQTAPVGSFSHSIAESLERVSAYILFALFLATLCLPGGVAEKHFEWSPKLNAGLRRSLKWLIAGFLFPAFVLILDRAMDPADASDQLGRIVFIVAVIFYCIVTLQMLHPERGYVWNNKLSGSDRVRTWGWAIFVISAPVALMIAAVLGYMYAATVLMSKLLSTLIVIATIALLHSFVERWLLIINRNLLREQTKRERLAEYEALLKAADKDDETPPEPEEPEIDLQSLDADTRKLNSTGLFFIAAALLSAIWAEVIVAFGFFREVKLWSYIDGVPGSEQLVNVTLANLFFAVVFLVATYVGAKAIPSILDVLLRTRTKVTSGARLAYTSLMRYAIIIIGVALLTDEIGFQWSQIQFLVAALGVGIGFGLQEIVANFISGLIILVERPIRVGDVVTVNNVSGTVTKIQIRATTITNWDRQELLVPNREFIANQVLNWSLSDDILRLVIKVGVAYGSDVPKALEIMEDVARSDARVLKDPRPFCTFDEFGDSALQLTLRAYVGSPQNRFQTASDINLGIDERFKEAGLVIAFPQRDLHLNTTEPLEITLSKGSEA